MRGIGDRSRGPSLRIAYPAVVSKSSTNSCLVSADAAAVCALSSIFRNCFNFVMDHKLMYAFRGWIAFVAFMDLGTAVRCFIEKRAFFGQFANANAVANLFVEMDDPTLPRILGYYSILKALSLIHCTLFIHYKPVVSLGISSIVLAILMYVAEVAYYHSTTFNFYVAFPCTLNALTLAGLLILPRRLWEPLVVNEDENTELLRHATVLRRRRGKRSDECS